jgi:multisubunit Na+/H+ antiporter MnhB subunit
VSDKEPLVDPGIIQVSLGITTVGFFLERFVPPGLGLTVFLGAAAVTFVFYVVYLVQWAERHELWSLALTDPDGTLVRLTFVLHVSLLGLFVLLVLKLDPAALHLDPSLER